MGKYGRYLLVAAIVVLVYKNPGGAGHLLHQAMAAFVTLVQSL